MMPGQRHRHRDAIRNDRTETGADALRLIRSLNGTSDPECPQRTPDWMRSGRAGGTAALPPECRITRAWPARVGNRAWARHGQPCGGRDGCCPAWRSWPGYQRSWLRGDVLAGLTVAAYPVPKGDGLCGLGRVAAGGRLARPAAHLGQSDAAGRGRAPRCYCNSPWCTCRCTFYRGRRSYRSPSLGACQAIERRVRLSLGTPVAVSPPPSSTLSPSSIRRRSPRSPGPRYLYPVWWTRHAASSALDPPPRAFSLRGTDP
jgi:hypothetical protein